MPVTVLMGAQWGDEGKGKVIDVLTENADWIVRYQGGNNAGHTVEVGDEKYVLHLLPSGVLREDNRCVIGNGVVVDPFALTEEIHELEERGIILSGRLFVSDRAHLVLPYHRAMDVTRETQTEGSKQSLGTTKRGIGFAYGDKAARIGLRVGDLQADDFNERLAHLLGEKNRMLEALGTPPFDEAKLQAEMAEATSILSPYITDTLPVLHQALARDESILCEGAQGTMLDIDFGTYPYVTSSNASTGGACTGTGIPPNRIDRVIGVIKAYTTRVGAGPFPTELTDKDGQAMARIGHEFGATTGRPRRCGWFDAVVARYSAQVNGVDAWAITKLDVLDTFPLVRICTGYEIEGRVIDHLPGNIGDFARCTPVYEEVEGWQTSTRDIETFDKLPVKARNFLRRVEEITNVPGMMVSVGPHRNSTIPMEAGGALVSV